MIILLDNGHGQNTMGKRAPDDSLYEWEYNRQIAKEVYNRLMNNTRFTSAGHSAHLIVQEYHDIGLGERCKRANKYNNSLLVSIHVNAAPGYGWQNARGWQVHVSLNSSQTSKQLADVFFDEAGKQGLKTRRPSPNKKYWENDFYILKRTKCPAILTENLFMNNKEDVKFLLSETGRETIINLHVNAILTFLENNGLL